MVASVVFITDLGGKVIISRNYRGDIPLTKATERFSKYLTDVEDEAKKPVFHVDSNGDVITDADDVGSGGVGGETFVYIQVRKTIDQSAALSCGDSSLTSQDAVIVLAPYKHESSRVWSHGSFIVTKFWSQF
mmetsp:Transcript_32250/g.96706  ORF Transcript_32250/g.96706 Transcript_32250/m.96706 type:complete len:132 (-) Transcript_32250:1518-1913(-)